MNLFNAAKAGDLERLRILVERGGDVEQTNSEGRTPLFAASRRGHLAVVQFLMEQQTVKRRRRFLFTIASWFMLFPLIFVLVVLLLGATAWSKLSQRFPTYTNMIDNLTCVQILVKKIGNLGMAVVRTIGKINKTDSYGETAIYVASGNGHLAVVRYLVKKEAYQRDFANIKGWTPLINAAANGHLAVVRFFIEQGVKIDKADFTGLTPLNHASSTGYLRVVRYLVEQGANIDKENNEGRTSLSHASINGHLEVVRYLLEQGADRDKASKDGWTPLHRAASQGRLEIAKLLMMYGADLNAKNAEGRLPIDEAIWYEEIKQAIRDEPRRRMDAAPGKRAAEQDRHRNAATSASAQQGETYAEEGKVAEEDEDSEPSSDEEDD